MTGMGLSESVICSLFRLKKEVDIIVTSAPVSITASTDLPAIRTGITKVGPLRNIRWTTTFSPVSFNWPAFGVKPRRHRATNFQLTIRLGAGTEAG